MASYAAEIRTATARFVELGEEIVEVDTRFAGGAPGPVDDTAPVVSNVSPVASSSIASNTPLLQRITDAEALSGVVIQVRYAGVWEVAYSGSLVSSSWVGAFGPNYLTSSITAATGGYDFSLVRTGGWGIEGTALEILPFATDGNTNV